MFDIFMNLPSRTGDKLVEWVVGILVTGYLLIVLLMLLLGCFFYLFVANLS